MRTDDLITALTRDAPVAPPVWRRPLPLIAFGALVSIIAFALFLPVRPDFLSAASLGPTLHKWALGLGLTALGGLAVLRLRRPEGSPAPLAALLVLAASFALATIGRDLAVNGLAGFSVRMLGSSVMNCLTSIGWLSLAPLAASLVVLRAGAVTAPATAGFAAGLMAAGLAVLLYAMKCTEDSLTFVVAWYGLAAFLVAGLAALLGRVLLRW
jgi:hypothetical protein